MGTDLEASGTKRWGQGAARRRLPWPAWGALLFAALLGIATSAQGQGIRNLAFTEQDVAAAIVLLGPGAVDQSLMAELHGGYLQASGDLVAVVRGRFQEARERTDEPVEAVRQLMHDAVAVYEAEHADLNDSFIGDLVALHAADGEADAQVRMLLEHLRRLRSDIRGAGNHGHPIVAWARAFPGEPMPPEVRALCLSHEEVLHERLHTRAQLRRAARHGDIHKHLERIGGVDIAIKSISDACAEQVGALLGPVEARRFLQQYWQQRFEDLYRTEIDHALDAVDEQTVDAETEERLARFREWYWPRLQQINVKPRAAREESLRAQYRWARKEITLDEWEQAKAAREKAMNERARELAAMMEELKSIIPLDDLKQYWRSRFPDLYRTEIDDALDAIDEGHLAPDVAERLAQFRESYWLRLHRINVKSHAASEEAEQARHRMIRGEIAVEAWQQAKTERKALVQERSEELAALMEELKSILPLEEDE